MSKQIYWWVAKVYIGSELQSLHFIPGNQNYNSLISLDFFRGRQTKEHYKEYMKSGMPGSNYKNYRWVSVDWFSEYMHTKLLMREKFRNKRYRLTHKKPLSYPFMKHKSVWDFYKAIGYDYKKKKFI